jgi:manganese-dependent inorganic pyrophosphatase
MSTMAAPRDVVLVLGHRIPDTDAVCSALAYARLFGWQTGRPTRACHLDELNSETAFVLQRFGLDAPQPIEDVYLRAADVMDRQIPAVDPETTLREAGTLLRERGLNALPVIDGEGRLVGIFAADALGAHYLEELKLSHQIDLPVTLLRRTLDASLLAGDVSGVVRDRLLIATFSSESTPRYVEPGDALILGDQPNVMRAALRAGASCLIVCDGASVPDDVLAEASARQALVLATAHAPFATALLIQQSVPVGRMMRPAEPQLLARADATLEEAQEQIRRENLPALAIVDEAGVLLGLLLRRHLLAQGERPIVLTDHNHPDQAAPGVERSLLLAIVDHHNLGGLQTLQPLSMQVEPVGCTCTLIAEQFRRFEAPLDAPLAGAMLAAILSDTVGFRSPTTTARDREAAAWLAERCGEVPEELARAMFRARLPQPTPPARWWVHKDYKEYRFGALHLGIGQVELADVEDVMPPRAALIAELDQATRAGGLDGAFLVLTDIFEARSVLLADSPASLDLAARAFGVAPHEGALRLPGVMSRKKQVVPTLAAGLAALP